ncbi:tRNA (adenosine(37)-N6)-dimethylallyltransferase MiaA [Thiorhodovibrio winogradskyi]|nr:tRNA (adenosine(37)-N6)-dimethylallyltransferase MiaA [Thiorhodovibrio winogradskyi]
MGPTAAGKTALALDLVERLPCEIISVDSALVYQGMDIGTAKPSPEIRARVPHRLMDILDPGEAYSAARFRLDALRAMEEITGVGRVPLLVGGTMLYFRALVRGLAPLPRAHPELRRDLSRQLERMGSARMHRWLAVLDAASAARIHPNDPQRIQRALEVYLTTGRALGDHWAEAAAQHLPYRVVKLVKAPGPTVGQAGSSGRERQALRERIAQRFDAMLAAGFEAEVARLRARGDLHPALPSMRAVGYRQMWHYLDGDCDFARMRELAITATRQLAKRQMTWLRSESDCIWLPQGGSLLDRALERLANLAAIGEC